MQQRSHCQVPQPPFDNRPLPLAVNAPSLAARVRRQACSPHWHALAPALSSPLSPGSPRAQQPGQRAPAAGPAGAGGGGLQQGCAAGARGGLGRRAGVPGRHAARNTQGWRGVRTAPWGRGSGKPTLLVELPIAQPLPVAWGGDLSGTAPSQQHLLGCLPLALPYAASSSAYAVGPLLWPSSSEMPLLCVPPPPRRQCPT